MRNIQLLEAAIKKKTVMLISREECGRVINYKKTMTYKKLKAFEEYAVKSM